MDRESKIEYIRKGKFPFRPWDLTVYAAAVIAVVFILVSISRPKGETLKISYYDKGNVRQTVQINMNTDAEFDLFEKYSLFGEGRLIVIVKNGEAWVERADCPDKICMHMPHISRVGQQIVCQPYRVVLLVGRLDFGFIEI